jgi:hypothetical protein
MRAESIRSCSSRADTSYRPAIEHRSAKTIFSLQLFRPFLLLSVTLVIQKAININAISNQRMFDFLIMLCGSGSFEGC